MRIAFIVNVDWFFVSHRLPIAMRALDEGHECVGDYKRYRKANNT